MEELKELVQLISRQKVDQIDIVSQNNGNGSKLQVFYHGILKGNINSDEDAIKLLYKNRSNQVAYVKLKNRLKKKLIDTLFFIDIKSNARSGLDILKYQNFKSFSAYKILLERGKRKMAIKLAENVFRSAFKGGLTELSLLTAKDLRIHYGIFEFNNHKFKKYDDKIQLLTDILQAELFVDRYYILLAQTILKSKSSTKKAVIKQLEPEIHKIQDYQSRYSTYSLNLRAFNTIYFYYFLQKKYTALVRICNRAIEYFKPKSEYAQFAIFDFKVKLALAKINLKEFDEAKDILESCLEMGPTKGSVHWYNVMNYLFIVSIILKDYKEAYKVISEALNHVRFKGLYESFKEPWYIKEAYINFLIKIDKIELDDSEIESLRSFRLSRFLNEVPLYSKDKRGLNITILILHVLFLIVEKKYDDIIDRIDALKQYSYRYLRNDETFRSSCFIKMLLKIPDAEYHPLRLKRYTTRLYERLSSTPVELSEQYSEIEVIPYENLWELIVEILHRNLPSRSRQIVN